MVLPEATGDLVGEAPTAAGFLATVQAVIQRVIMPQEGAVARGASLIATAVQRGGVIQAFGSGHSEALSMEIAGRAGGLIPANRIALRDLVLAGGADPAILADPGLERDPTIAKRLYELAGVSERDMFVLTSNSGVNGAVIELALLVKEHGHDLIAVTSLAHTRAVVPRHRCGKRLADLADVVLDNGAPLGDAVLPLPGGGAVGAVSSITGAILTQQLVVTAVGLLLAEGACPPIYRSVNVPGGDEHNQALEARYAGRIRRIS
ncbi:MAG: SIS domain-containing protein [Micromonosporaceae bacterium]|nr:SIS domain-containing protein [Micromonosporaceae bacterium]